MIDTNIVNKPSTNLKNTKILLFILILLLSVFLRFYHLDNFLLWQDEAETGILAEKIMKEGYPNGILNDKVMFTGRLKEKECISDCTFLDPNKYDLSQVDYSDDGVLRYGSLSVLYLVSSSYFLFGISTLTTRLFPVIISILSLIFLYKLSTLFYNYRVGLIAMLIHTINPIMINYERFAEYDSLSLFSFLSTTYFIYLLLASRKSKYILPSILSLTLLIYTNPIIALPIIMLACIYAIYDFFFLKNNNINYLLSVFFIVLILCIPFLAFLLKFISVNPVFYTFSEYSNRIFSKLHILLFISILTTGGYLVLIGLISSFFSKKKIVISLIFFSVLLSYLLFMPPAHPLDRIIIFTIPLFAIYSASTLSIIFSNRNYFLKILGLVLLLIIMLFPFLLSYPFLSVSNSEINVFKVTYETSYFGSPLNQYITALINNKSPPIRFSSPWQQSGWVKEAILLLNKEGVSNEPIFVTHQNTVFNFYNRLNAELVWPIKETFFDQINGRFWIILEPNKVQLEKICLWFNHDLELNDRCIKKNYKQRIESCKETILMSGAKVYECNN